MNLIALDTSSLNCSVAVFNGDKIYAFDKIVTKEHASIILPAMDELLKKAHLDMNDLDQVVLGRGPGSFTGLRIAASVAQGLATALKLKILPLSSLQALAQGAYRKFNIPTVFAAMDARMQEIYCAEYELNDQHIMQAISEEQVLPCHSITLAKTQHICGNAWQAYEKDFQRAKSPLHALDHCYPEAKDLITIALKSTHEAVEPENALPVYVRNKVT